MLIFKLPYCVPRPIVTFTRTCAEVKAHVICRTNQSYISGTKLKPHLWYSNTIPSKPSLTILTIARRPLLRHPGIFWCPFESPKCVKGSSDGALAGSIKHRKQKRSGYEYQLKYNSDARLAALFDASLH